MRTLVLFAAVVITAVSFSAFVAAAAGPAVIPAALPSYSFTLTELTPKNATAPVFVPAKITIPQVPINVTLTFVNGENATSGLSHNLTFANASGVAKMFTGEVPPGSSTTLAFTIHNLTSITYQSTSFRPNLTAVGGIAFFDADHPKVSGEIELVAGGPVPHLYIQVDGQNVGSSYTFTPTVIVIPQVPVVLNITFRNNQSASVNMPHTFTINDDQGNPVIDTGLINSAETANVEFTINSMTNITYKGKSFTPGPAPNLADNGTIQFYCIPHVSLGMRGVIVLGGLPQPVPAEKGVLLRAYWIGMIGIAATVVWIGISYFVIKSSSPRFKDNKEHVRKGLP